MSLNSLLNGIDPVVSPKLPVKEAYMVKGQYA